VNTTTVVGGGDARFILVYEPKEANTAFAQVMVEAESVEQIPAAMQNIEAFVGHEVPNLDPIVKPLRLGPGHDSKIEARFHGSGPVILRDLAEQAKAIMRSDPRAKEIRDDWRNPVPFIEPMFNEQMGRNLGITREDVAKAMKFTYEGSDIGLYRDDIRLLPIIWLTVAIEFVGHAPLCPTYCFLDILQL